jgi:SSS family solute:Na+ symporter
MAIIFLFSQMGIIIIMMYYNAAFMEYLWGIPKMVTISIIGFIGGIIIYSGGMLSKIRLDLMVVFLFFVSAFILLLLCLIKVEGVSRFIHLAHGRLEVALPSNHTKLPWTSVFIGGLWLMHIQYWAFYQPIAQTVVASATLSEAQKGMLFAATAKIFTPFLMIIPGIIGYELYSSQITSIDDVLPLVIKNVAPYGLGGIILIGYISTMFTTFTGHLNATMVVFTNDLFPFLAPEKLRSMDSIKVARISTLVIAFLSIVISYYLVPEGAFFKFTELTLLMVAPISTSVFLFAIFSRRTSSMAAIVTMVTGIPLFFILKSYINMSLLNISGITFLVLCGLMGLIRILSPLPSPVVMPEKFAIKFERNLIVEIWGIFIIVAILAIYVLLL